MYQRPSRKKNKHEIKKLNLVPILDAIFIFIFFLLMTANFTKIFQIGSDVPILSNTPPSKSQKPLALTIQILQNNIRLFTGVPSKARTAFGKTAEGEYDLESLHNYLVDLKKKYVGEKTIIIEPRVDIEFQKLVDIMDAVRMYRTTDESLYVKDEQGLDVKVEELFNNIVFGNIKGI